MSRAGFVLVGGNSSRMGRDKALLPYRGLVLAQHVARQVEAAAGSATLIGTPERYRSLGFPVAEDQRPGQGPLGGIETALSISGAEWNLVVACDMPALSERLLASLLEAAERAAAEADCLLPRSATGRPEPLCAVYRHTCLGQIRQALDNGVRKITDALEGLRIRLEAAPLDASFDNLNTPDEWKSHLNTVTSNV